MTREKKRDFRWLLTAVAAASTMMAFAIVLFLGVPALMRGDHGTEYEAVDPEGWSPRCVTELCRAASTSDVAEPGAADMQVRYDASAPDEIKLVVNSVISDGSELRDTVRVPLRDSYGRPLGTHGYFMSEIETRLDITSKTGGRRLVELYPADTIRGIHAMRILLKKKEQVK